MRNQWRVSPARHIAAALLLTVAILPLSCRKVSVPEAPHPRIISYAPALTEMLFDMGLSDHIVGVTQWCILPDGQSRPVVGNETNPNIAAILAVRPDVIVTISDPDKLRKVKEALPSVRIERVPTETLADVKNGLRTLARLAGQPKRGEEAAATLQKKLDAVRERVAGKPRPRVLFVMGYKQPSVAGAGTFIGDLITVAGGINVGAEIPGPTRYRRTNDEAILKVQPDVLICQMWENGQDDAARKHYFKLQDMPAARTGRIFVVTDRQWTIPSGRLGYVAEKLADIIHPGTVTRGAASD